MYIIIVGGGDLGFSLAKEFFANGHEALIIEKDAARCEEVKQELGSISICGSGSEIATLDRAGIARTDMFIAVTREDEENLAACQIAKQKFNVPRVIARVNNPRNEPIFAKLGIDYTVNVVGLVMENIKVLSGIFPLARLFSFKDRGTELILAKIPDGSLVGRPLKDLPLPEGAVVTLLIRQGEESKIPVPETVLRAGDELLCLIPGGSEESLQAALGQGRPAP
ncbi:MAG: portal protein [Chloroflexi bacterium CG_4_9_14_3_um_filter_45_9]|nr:MAG: hypothetical protein AUK00_03345 [Dehalococcoidia bacterium CG2_30_46_9]PIU23381.1 MAG: portal protein [Chloroflexi bacterium CG08_land_8_20_14_0_20_45_12]PIX27799.1 MAG: portal protein [Chloroflexi bacterium CG_4_8_14_3_um_filter_45_15]PJB51005.1 MAG: portal protein [Chloroflexi bacterium CG_4_9_14_3_um_filter_45_9]